VFGEVFHIFVPWVIHYGNVHSRHGEVHVVDGTYINLRAFALPYADYRGSFFDNPFMIQFMQAPAEMPPGFYAQNAVDSFREIARQGRGNFIFSTPDDLVEDIHSILENIRGNADIVILLDTTASMQMEIRALRTSLIPMLRDITQSFNEWRIGLVSFKDYGYDYVNRTFPFTNDFNVLQRTLNTLIARGGGDIPEAVYEAIYEGAVSFPWEAENRIMILIGDAPPHPRQRGRVSREMAENAVSERNIRLSAIILPP